MAHIQTRLDILSAREDRPAFDQRSPTTHQSISLDELGVRKPRGSKPESEQALPPFGIGSWLRGALVCRRLIARRGLGFRLVSG